MTTDGPPDPTGPDPWAVLGDPTRRSIIEHLSRRPSSVAQLAEVLPVSRPAVSQHLQLLKKLGVVHDRAEGTRRIYTVDAARLARYRRELDAFWGAALENLANLEDPARTDRPDGPDRDQEDP